jgi:hypothetical protein
VQPSKKITQTLFVNLKKHKILRCTKYEVHKEMCSLHMIEEHLYLKINNSKIERTHPSDRAMLFSVPSGTITTGGGSESLRSLTTPSSQLAVPSPPATYFQDP